MQKILFLDFDGVLNTENYQARLRSRGLPTWDGYGPLFDPEAVDNLRKILDLTDAGVVICSSWKLEGLDRMRALWRDRRLPGKVTDITPDALFHADILTIDLDDPDTFKQLAGKGNEVRLWLGRHPDDVRYAILDDVPDFLPCQTPFYVMTAPRTGITPEDAMKVIEILNS